MNIGKAIYSILSNDSSVSSTVGTRIFPSRYIDESGKYQLPFISYQVVSVEPNNTKNGVSTYDYTTAQINIVGNSYNDVITLAQNVRTALDYTSGTYEGVVVDKIFFENSVEVFDENAGSVGLYQISQDYRFNINR